MRIEKMKALWGQAAVVVVSIVLLTACSAIPGLEPAPTTTTLTTELLSPLEILQKSVERQKNIKSFRSSIDVILSAMGERVTMTADIKMDQDGRMRMATSMDTPDGEMSFTFIISEPDLYMKMPDADWVLIPGGAAEELMDESLSGFETDLLGSFFSAEEIPWDSFSVKSLGKEHVDNVETEHLWIQVDLQKLWQEAPDETKQFIESVLSEEFGEFQEFLEELRQMDLDLWIDDQGYSRRARIEMNISNMMFVEMDQRMFDFNEDIVIGLPQNAVPVTWVP